MKTPEKGPTLRSSLPQISLSEEVATAFWTSAQALCRPIALLPFQLVRGFLCDDVGLVIVHIVEGQFCPGWNGFGGEEGEVIDVDVGMIV